METDGCGGSVGYVGGLVDTWRVVDWCDWCDVLVQGFRIGPVHVWLQVVTPWKTNMEPDNPWLLEENRLPWDQDVRVYVSFRECM